ncbi:MAG: hypothetical protein JKY56_23275 [Kofleriaceae bacterium]|nr:hypothetical protein [Kofleriaceae bacterium]
MFSPTPHLLSSLCAIVTIWGCGKSNDKDSEGEGAARETIVETTTAQTPKPGPLDTAFVPIDVLTELEGISLTSNSPCTESLESLKPLLAAISAGTQSLAKADSLSSVGETLATLSDKLSVLATKIIPRAESEELRRISAEVLATMTDLAESLKLASDAALKRNKQEAGAATRRLQNGVANTRSAIEGLANQCAQ